MQKLCTITEAWDRKYPEQVVLAITKSKDGRINLMAIGWVCLVSDAPPMFLLGIDDPAYTLELIRENKEFVIAYPSRDMDPLLRNHPRPRYRQGKNFRLEI